MLKSNGALSTEEREEEMKQMEVYRSHSKFMKNKVECVFLMLMVILFEDRYVLFMDASILWCNSYDDVMILFSLQKR